MCNALTGDFDAVLQVSGGTLNRLLASMHQNGGTKTDRPIFPHSVTAALGEREVIDGVRGRLEAQVSVPQIELIDRADDRFVLHFSIRARYLPDHDSAPLADLISGNVRAEYRLADIDPSRNGRARGAADYLSFKVVEDSVEFHGTVDNELDPAGGGLPLDVPATIDKVNRQLRHLLTIAFSAPPQRVSKRFSRGSMMSLAKGPGNTAVAIPLAPPGPALESIDQVVLEGHDFGVALRAEVLLRQIRPVLEDMRAGFVEHISFRDIQYNLTLISASAEWTGIGFIVHMSGQALTEKSEYDLTFDITQSVLVGFDAVSEGLSFVSEGAPAVAIHYVGPCSGDVIDTATPRIQAQATAQVQGLLDQVAGRFDLSPQKAELIDQLGKFDDAAAGRFEGLSSSIDGVVLLGRIVLSPRRAPVVMFEKTPEGNAFTAWESWIPGGRIDAFAWSWSWGADPFTPPGSQSDQITFRLSRPIPGLDGMGTLSLNIEGKQADSLSGDLADAVREHGCRIFHEPGSNRLVVHVGDRWPTETAAVLRDGLGACRRQDAGLAVIVMFAEGRLDSAAIESGHELRALIADLEAPTILREDVNGEWSGALAVPDGLEQPAWRLISSTGGVAWMSDDVVTAEELGSALDRHLFPSPPPVARPYRATDPSVPARPAIPVRGGDEGGRALVFAAVDVGLEDDAARGGTA